MLPQNRTVKQHQNRRLRTVSRHNIGANASEGSVETTSEPSPQNGQQKQHQIHRLRTGSRNNIRTTARERSVETTCEPPPQKCQ